MKDRKKIGTELKAADKKHTAFPAEDSSMAEALLNDIDGDVLASRRNFLKLCGFSFAATALASCRSKITKAIPYVIAPEEITPGEALYYASSYVNGSDYCSILVKNRDGRPIKIEGNPESGVTFGRTNARVQASVLDLYDTGRFHGPMINGNQAAWNIIDEEIPGKLQKISSEKGTIILLTPSIFSPSAGVIISDFIKKYPGTEWVRYDAISYSAMLEANLLAFGKQAIPDYRFDKADVIVNFGADFLGTWLSPVRYAGQFSSRRDPDNGMNYLIQLESNLSMTGCNADQRIQIKPSQETAILLNIYKKINKSDRNRSVEAPPVSIDIDRITERLLAVPGRSIVISRSNDRQNQLLVNEINRELGNIEKTILFDSSHSTHVALDSEFENAVGRMRKGEVSALLTWNVNPVYTWYDSKAFREGLQKVGLTISLSSYPDETNKLFQYICPDNHYLESWGDYEPVRDHFSLMQPAISPIFDTRQMTESLLKWSGSAIKMHDFIRNHWTQNLFPRQTVFKDPVAFLIMFCSGESLNRLRS